MNSSSELLEVGGWLIPDLHANFLITPNMIVLEQISIYHLYYARHMVVAILLESESAISNILISYGFTLFLTNN